MTLLSRKADYALLILWFLHRQPGGGSAREIAARFGLSRAFVANILKELCQQGFVASHRGVKGGYALLKAAEQLSLAELLEALEEPMQVAACSSHRGAGDGCSHEALCPLRGPIGAVHERIYEVLRAVKLADLFRPGAPAAAVLIPSEAIAAALSAVS